MKGRHLHHGDCGYEWLNPKAATSEQPPASLTTTAATSSPQQAASIFCNCSSSSSSNSRKQRCTVSSFAKNNNNKKKKNRCSGINSSLHRAVNRVISNQYIISDINKHSGNSDVGCSILVTTAVAAANLRQ